MLALAVRELLGRGGASAHEALHSELSAMSSLSAERGWDGHTKLLWA